MNTTQLRSSLRNELLKICDKVHDIFIYPDEYATLQNNDKYITLVFGAMPLDNGSKRGLRRVSIIGIVKGDNDSLMEIRDKFESDIFLKLYKNNSLACTITEIDSQNIFKPFGLDSGIYPPYSGTRIDIEVPQAMESIS